MNCGWLFFEKSQAASESQFLTTAHLSLLFPSRGSTRCICPVCKTSRFNERTGQRGRRGRSRAISFRVRRMIYGATRFSLAREISSWSEMRTRTVKSDARTHINTRRVTFCISSRSSRCRSPLASMPGAHARAIFCKIC